ncbi:unnamed protein product, partial [Mesorhabditis belari]|uniref:Uncharacterized protein n=1 Tax=Mesorhabditis belari TaxID=2138241 RepID=A0AAF3FF50_9BILA
MARRARRQQKSRRPSTPRYLKQEEVETKPVDDQHFLSLDHIQLIAPKSAMAQNKTAKKRRVTFADQDEIIVDKKARERSPDIFEPFEPVSPPRFVVHFVSQLETLTEDEDFEEEF